MRKLILTVALVAIIPCSAAMAQETRVTTTVTTQAPAVVNPEAVSSVAAPAPAQSVQVAVARQPGPDGVIREMGPQQVVTQAVPPPAAAYPPCTRGRTDSCYNPNPSKEADVRRDGTIGE